MIAARTSSCATTAARLPGLRQQGQAHRRHGAAERPLRSARRVHSSAPRCTSAKKRSSAASVGSDCGRQGLGGASSRSEGKRWPVRCRHSVRRGVRARLHDNSDRADGRASRRVVPRAVAGGARVQASEVDWVRLFSGGELPLRDRSLEPFAVGAWERVAGQESRPPRSVKHGCAPCRVRDGTSSTRRSRPTPIARSLSTASAPVSDHRAPVLSIRSFTR